MRSNFLLGELIVDPVAKQALKREPFDLIARHAVNDHGRASLRQHRLNLASLNTAGEIVSRYPVDPTDPDSGHVLVITHIGWDRTTVKLEPK